MPNTTPAIQPLDRDDAVVVAFTTNAGYAPFTSAALQSMLDHTDPSRFYDVVILHMSIPPRSAAALMEQVAAYPHVSLRLFDATDAFRALGMEGWASYPPYNGASYVQLLIPALCRNYPKVLALHGDIAVLADVAELFDTDVSGHLLAAAHNLLVPDQLSRMAGMKAFYRDVMGIDNPVDDLFNTAVMLFNVERLFAEGVVERWFREGPTPKNRYLEEQMLNVSCAKRVLFVDDTWNVMWSCLFPDDEFVTLPPDRRAALNRDARIIHYDGAMLRADRIFSADFALPWWRAARKTPFYEHLLGTLLSHKFASRRDVEQALGIRHRLGRYLGTAFSMPLRWLRPHTALPRRPDMMP